MIPIASVRTMPVTWLITGSSRGLGLEFVRQLSKENDNLIIATCRNPASASKLHEYAKNSQSMLHIVPLDTDDEASITQAAKEVSSKLGEGGVDYLLNNAASGGNGDTGLDLKPEKLLSSIRTNVAGPALVIQAFLPLIERSERKVVMNMSSGFGSIELDRGPREASYSISKAALNMLTYKLKADRPEIIFLSMAPGWVKTDMGGENAQLEPDFSVRHMLRTLRSLKPEDSGSFFRYDGTKLPW